MIYKKLILTLNYNLKVVFINNLCQKEVKITSIIEIYFVKMDQINSLRTKIDNISWNPKIKF